MATAAASNVLVERTVRYLVVTRGPRLGDRPERGVRVDVTRASAVLKLDQRVFHPSSGFHMRVRFEAVGVTAPTSRAGRGELPGGLIRIRRVTGRATRGRPVVARVFGRRVREQNRRPVRVAMACRAVARRGHVIGHFAQRGGAVVTALTAP